MCLWGRNRVDDSWRMERMNDIYAHKAAYFVFKRIELKDRAADYFKKDGCLPEHFIREVAEFDEAAKIFKKEYIKELKRILLANKIADENCGKKNSRRAKYERIKGN